MSPKVAVLGGGSWGTALAQIAAQSGHQVSIWDRSRELIEEMKATHENKRYHPGIPLHANVSIRRQLRETVDNAEIIILAVPSQAVGEAIRDSIKICPERTIFVCAAKGIDGRSLRTLSSVASDLLGKERADRKYTVLSGPTFAFEVIRNLPTAVTLAGRNPDTLKAVQEAIHTPTFRIYTTDDVTGVEIAGALKNVIAIVAGVADGLGFGHNARAALLTRGLVEISRIGGALGAHPMTFSGLAGMGDLMLTCTGDLSRNRRVGLKMAEGKPLKMIMKEVGQVAEGIRTAKNVYLLAQKMGLDVPIFTETYLALYEGKSPQKAVEDLLKRAPEFERA